jgi:hypothetical protein
LPASSQAAATQAAATRPIFVYDEEGNPPAELGGERPLILHNQLGLNYSIKLVYPGFFLTMRPNEICTTVGFTLQKEKLAKKVTPGHMFFVYVMAPERRIVGLGMATSQRGSNLSATTGILGSSICVWSSRRGLRASG